MRVSAARLSETAVTTRKSRCGCSAAVLLFLAMAPRATLANTVSVSPAADATVTQTAPTTNFGTGTTPFPAGPPAVPARRADLRSRDAVARLAATMQAPEGSLRALALTADDDVIIEARSGWVRLRVPVPRATLEAEDAVDRPPFAPMQKLITTHVCDEATIRETLTVLGTTLERVYYPGGTPHFADRRGLEWRAPGYWVLGVVVPDGRPGTCRKVSISLEIGQVETSVSQPCAVR